MIASASVCAAFRLNISDEGVRPPSRNASGRSSMRTRPRRTNVWRVDDGSSRRRNSARGNSPPLAASSARIAVCLSVSAGRRPSPASTAKRSMRRASRSAAAVSRAIHFLRAIPAKSGSDAAVAVRSVDTFTGSPEDSRSSTRRSMSWSSLESLPRRRTCGAILFPWSPSMLRARMSRPRSVSR